MRIAEALKKYPESIFGLMTVDNIKAPPDFKAWEDLKARETEAFRVAWKDYDRKNALQTPALAGYADYYKQYKKTYPVLLQMESVLLKGREVKASTLAVEAMFLAEVKHGLLAAGHDLADLSEDLALDLAKGGESFTVVSGERRTLKADDIFLAGGEKILSSVLEGQDYESRLTEGSAAAFYFAYGFKGVSPSQMEDFFSDLGKYLRAAWPQAQIQRPRIFTALGSKN